MRVVAPMNGTCLRKSFACNMLFYKKILLILVGMVLLYCVTLVWKMEKLSDVRAFQHYVKTDVIKLNAAVSKFLEGGGTTRENYTGTTRQNYTKFEVCKIKTSELRPYVAPKDRQRIVQADPTILGHVRQGGSFSPDNCTSSENVAIIVPFRNREDHLKIFLPHMHSFLQKQSLRYTIFIVEQEPKVLFNRGLLMNVGFVTALESNDFTCFVLHDVDLLPTNERNVYRCSNKTRHMSSANSKYGYKLLYTNYFGGVLSILPETFKAINGFSNLFFGWGQEDDDFFGRMRTAGQGFERLPLELGRYEALNHSLYGPQAEFALIARKSLGKSTAKRRTSEGLNSLLYERTLLEKKPLYTLVKVRVNETVYFQKFTACIKRGWPCPLKDIS